MNESNESNELWNEFQDQEISPMNANEPLSEPLSDRQSYHVNHLIGQNHSAANFRQNEQMNAQHADKHMNELRSEYVSK